ncbi:alpha/beta-hydrolase [Anaeromyces robustus]|uniref:Alpha/beta-hydrolase n=1 Tax=Anaeromyces robustus TaxID=1754192 RepID=A0A1Y1XCM5_9FUNG|nr:alpha/beta-hydrolase [Anaeromyces robustus]|eukprot:ORX83541.1 alpha/beta-hydrolase [Anaeromyces robustus]
MEEKVHTTSCGPIHYWVNHTASNTEYQLIFLPGLTADHRLFDKQIKHFQGKYPLMVWDAPGHAVSYPFDLTFSLFDKAKWLDEILIQEGFNHPVIIGQSMGGYLGQAYSQEFSKKLKGYISIDSAPLQREYFSNIELWMLKRMEPVYRYYPWKLLLKSGSKGTSTSEYGRKLMHDMTMVYDGDQRRYAKLSGHGFKILAEACETNLPFKLPPKSLLICGEKDKAGSCL